MCLQSCISTQLAGGRGESVWDIHAASQKPKEAQTRLALRMTGVEPLTCSHTGAAAANNDNETPHTQFTLTSRPLSLSLNCLGAVSALDVYVGRSCTVSRSFMEGKRALKSRPQHQQPRSDWLERRLHPGDGVFHLRTLPASYFHPECTVFASHHSPNRCS